MLGLLTKRKKKGDHVPRPHHLIWAVTMDMITAVGKETRARLPANKSHLFAGPRSLFPFIPTIIKIMGGLSFFLLSLPAFFYFIYCRPAKDEERKDHVNQWPAKNKIKTGWPWDHVISGPLFSSSAAFIFLLITNPELQMKKRGPDHKVTTGMRFHQLSMPVRCHLMPGPSRLNPIS
jgi:hypothetical protein